MLDVFIKNLKELLAVDLATTNSLDARPLFSTDIPELASLLL